MLSNILAALAAAVLMCCTLLAVRAAPPDISLQSLESRGERRTYHVFDPGWQDARPILLLLHGTGGTGRELVERWRGLAEREGLVLAAPASTDPTGWRVPRDGPDLFRDVVNHVEGRRPVDRRRLYLLGYSAGGDAALFASLAQSEYFAASVVLAAALRPRQYPLIDLAARRIPIALFAASRDTAYPIAETRGTRDAFRTRNFQIDYVELQGRHHGDVGRARDVMRQAWRFLRTHRLEADAVYRPLDARTLALVLR